MYMQLVYLSIPAFFLSVSALSVLIWKSMKHGDSWRQIRLLGMVLSAVVAVSLIFMASYPVMKSFLFLKTNARYIPYWALAMFLFFVTVFSCLYIKEGCGDNRDLRELPILMRPADLYLLILGIGADLSFLWAVSAFVNPPKWGYWLVLVLYLVAAAFSEKRIRQLLGKIADGNYVTPLYFIVILLWALEVKFHEPGGIFITACVIYLFLQWAKWVWPTGYSRLP